MTRPVPKGFQLSAVHCGIKKRSENNDLVLIASDRDAVAAGVYTQNLVFAAPVALDRQRTPGNKLRAVVCNSGNANACTGERGLADARRTADWVGESLGVSGEQVLVLSTGIIGEFLPMDIISAGIPRVAAKLADDDAALQSAARGMMTTDSVPKISSRTLELDGCTVQLTGLCKGAAMIGPNMATMLGVVMTDAALAPNVAQDALRAAVQDSFNCLSVEGHMSTNDTVLLLANGAADGPQLKGESRQKFQEALKDVCAELAHAIAADGEGTTHVITLHVQGCASRESAMTIAKTVANSALVKTAIAGADPNWGRIVSAAGYAGVPFDPLGVTLHVLGFFLYERGQPLPFDAEKVSKAIQENREVEVILRFSEGDASVRFWTTDLTQEYVRLNADYHT